ncbi:MAG: hypothetical protein E7Z64_03705 [Thermoplasmata archaeon]|jgi:pantoate kinase|nr:hypothetical protein [Thermoplasmata archaeon]
MKAKTFVPGHISCIFRPVRTDNIITTGSLGFGIRLSLGCTATVWERTDDEINICINGRRCEASVTRSAIEAMDPGIGLEIRLKHDLPLEQGFGTSASGTYAAALCTAELLGMDPMEAARVTHSAECSLGGGLGDLLAIASGFGVPIRERPGVPGLTGSTSDSGLELDRLSLLIFDEPLLTQSVLSDECVMRKIAEQGDLALRRFKEDPTVGTMFAASNSFSENIGIESSLVKGARTSIRDEGYSAAMCMLGNSIFTDAPSDVLEEMYPEATVMACRSYAGPIQVSRI